MKIKKIGRLLIGWDIAERCWCLSQENIRHRFIFSINQVYSREHRMYAWDIIIGRFHVMFNLLK